MAWDILYLLRTAREKKGICSMVRGYKAKFVKRFLKGSLERHPDILSIRVVFKSTSGMFKCVTTKCSLQYSALERHTLCHWIVIILPYNVQLHHEEEALHHANFTSHQHLLRFLLLHLHLLHNPHRILFLCPWMNPYWQAILDWHGQAQDIGWLEIFRDRKCEVS